MSPQTTRPPASSPTLASTYTPISKELPPLAAPIMTPEWLLSPLLTDEQNEAE